MRHQKEPANKRLYQAFINVIISGLFIMTALAILFLVILGFFLDQSGFIKAVKADPGTSIFVTLMLLGLSIVGIQELRSAGSKFSHSMRLRTRSRLLKLFAVLVAVTPYTVLLLLFYIFNSGAVSTVVQVAGNSFLGMFILLNILNYLNASRSNSEMV